MIVRIGGGVTMAAVTLLKSRHLSGTPNAVPLATWVVACAGRLTHAPIALPQKMLVTIPS